MKFGVPIQFDMGIDFVAILFLVGILNPRWGTKYKNAPILMKFSTPLQFDMLNKMATILFFGGHFESKMAAEI